MLDIQQLRTNLDAVAEGLAKRGKPIDFAEFKALEAERKTLQTRATGPKRSPCRISASMRLTMCWASRSAAR